MSRENDFCSRCGTPRTQGKKFCGACGNAFPAPASTKETVAAVKESANAVASVARSVEAAASAAGKAASIASGVSHFVVAPPAQWKVVVGDAMPSLGKAVVDKAAGTVQAKVEDAIGSVVSEAVDQVIVTAGGGAALRCPSCGNGMMTGAKFCGECGEKTSPPVPASPVPGRCPSCGAALTPGKKFCGACGTALTSTPSLPTGPPPCPSCGDPITPGEKFCGACGRKLG